MLDSSTLEGQKNWVDYLEFKFDKGELNDLVPREENKDMDVGEYLWDQKEKAKGRQLNEGVISVSRNYLLVAKNFLLVVEFLKLLNSERFCFLCGANKHFYSFKSDIFRTY